mmetsp:Transcript_31349/g.57370  ORF Transcript_31349/g.57370 Transcript_31349/m.57370 type:complete len:433 (-) Transcript_31349:1062-2360(-)
MTDCTSSSNDANGISQKEPPPTSHQQQQQQRQQRESTIKSIFSTPDILVHILQILIDDDFLPSLSSLVLVSKNFREASESDQLWCRVCYGRWKSKFGFRGRWERASVDYSSFVVVSDGERGVDVVDVVDDKGVVERPRMEQQRMEQQRRMEPSPSSLQVDEPDSASKNSTANDNDTNNNNFWKARYFAEERDATRTNISATELESLVFDFRFWIGQPTVTVDGHIVVKSGLLESASREVRFTNSTPIVMDGDGDDDNGGGDDGMENSDESREEFPGGMWSARGHLMGHPCREPGIEWFLDEAMGIVQWGFIPNLWPQGNIQRLDNWGWQIQNPNMILRSIDDTTTTATTAAAPSSLAILSSESNNSEWDETKLDEIERECSKSDGKDDVTGSNEMWRDLLDTMENIPLRNTPSVNGFQVTADIPRAFMEEYE